MLASNTSNSISETVAAQLLAVENVPVTLSLDAASNEDVLSSKSTDKLSTVDIFFFSVSVAILVAIMVADAQYRRDRIGSQDHPLGDAM